MDTPQGTPDTGDSSSEGSSSAGDAGRLGRAKEFVGEKYTAASQAVRDGYSSAREKVGSTYGQAREKIEEVDFAGMMDQGRSFVRSNPGKALLVSVGVGFLIGLLLRRDDD